MSDTYKHYLQDLSFLLKERAHEAKKEWENASDEDEAFAEGYLSAYHHVLETMKNQAFAFNIDEKEIKLDDINPDKDLLG